MAIPVDCDKIWINNVTTRKITKSCTTKSYESYTLKYTIDSLFKILLQNYTNEDTVLLVYR